jgi:hypothetical protein
MYSKEFDKQLKEISHYSKYPVLMPFVGLNYNNVNSKRLLLIGESHYLPKNSVVSKDANKWYNSNINDLTSEEIDYINTRGVTTCKWDKPGHMIFRELEKRMSNHIEKYNGRSINSCAFMNGFQRPSPENGGSIKKFCTEQDYKISSETINSVINIIEPEFVIFVSKLTWDKLGWRVKKGNKNIRFDFVCHPGTGGNFWHNSKYPHGVKKFIDLISK